MSWELAPGSFRPHSPSPGQAENGGFSIKLLAPLSWGWLVHLSFEASNQIALNFFFLWMGASVLLGHKSKELNNLAPSRTVSSRYCNQTPPARCLGLLGDWAPRDLQAGVGGSVHATHSCRLEPGSQNQRGLELRFFC